jgi:hypothetical protein
MSAGASTPSTTGNHLKNVIIGVITTVISATVIYFLGFHSPESDEFKKAKQATIDAWNSLQLYENEFKEKATSMVCSGSGTGFTDKLLNEYEKIIKNINNIQKEEHVDNRLMSLIDRRVSTLEDKKTATADYYRQYDSLGSDDSDPRVIHLYNDFMEKIKELEVQDTSFINNVNAEIKKKYKVDFKFPAPIVITTEFLTGNWTLDREKNISLNKNEKFVWKNSDQSFDGTWSLSDLDLSFKFSDGSTVDYNIQRASQTFVFAVDTAGAPHYFCR